MSKIDRNSLIAFLKKYYDIEELEKMTDEELEKLYYKKRKVIDRDEIER